MRRRFGLTLAAVALLSVAMPGAADPVDGATVALNGLRGKVGLGPLTRSGALQQAAERHAQAMAREGFFAHEGPEGASVGQRARAAGYSFCFVAENIAKGQRDLREVMLAWATSDSHRANMLNPLAAEYGLARQAGDIWVLVLGASRC